MKRLFDIFFSTIGLVLVLPFFVFFALLIKLSSKGEVFFKQERVGQNFNLFKIYKFRTMIKDAESKGPKITVAGDQRITKIGKLLRKYKIDELPQLINVLKGEMSFVGPRPEVIKYVNIFKTDYEKLLTVRPGITDPASIKFSKEESVLSLSTSWEEDYLTRILPEKIKLSVNYVDNCSVFTDIKLILKTVFLKCV